MSNILLTMFLPQRKVYLLLPLLLQEHLPSRLWIRLSMGTNSFCIAHQGQRKPVLTIQNIDPFDAANRYWSPGSIKFTDGRFGCNIGINCQPQITAYADTPVLLV